MIYPYDWLLDLVLAGSCSMVCNASSGALMSRGKYCAMARMLSWSESGPYDPPDGQNKAWKNQVPSQITCVYILYFSDGRGIESHRNLSVKSWILSFWIYTTYIKIHLSYADFTFLYFHVLPLAFQAYNPWCELHGASAGH